MTENNADLIMELKSAAAETGNRSGHCLSSVTFPKLMHTNFHKTWTIADIITTPSSLLAELTFGFNLQLVQACTPTNHRQNDPTVQYADPGQTQ